jgi:hypothetical protein
MHYQQVSRIVNGSDLLQVGIVFANEVFLFQFNLFFDRSSRHSASKSLRFIIGVAKLRLDEHGNRGIPSITSSI